MNYKEQIKRLQYIYPDAREVECQHKPQQEPNQCIDNSIDYSKAHGWEVVAGWLGLLGVGEAYGMLVYCSAHCWNKKYKKHRDTTRFNKIKTMPSGFIYIYSPSVSKWLNKVQEDYNNRIITEESIHSAYDWDDEQGWVRHRFANKGGDETSDKLFQNTYEFDSRLITTLE